MIKITVLPIFVIIFAEVRTQNITHNTTESNNNEMFSVNDVANTFVSIFKVNKTSNERLKELEEKLSKIDKYVINKDAYSELLMNETFDTNLTETNFFEALSSNEKYLLKNETKNLYLKLKEKMNRDDFMKIFGENLKSRRKGSGSREDVDMVVDEMIAEVPADAHKFDRNSVDSPLWDPQEELEELKQYHQHDGRRIYKGERTHIRFYPFMVSVHVMGRFWCGGALYWDDLVLTSAACLQLMHNNRFFRENPRVLSVRVGSNHSRIGGEVIEALEVYFHPGYNPRTLKNNIAVIRLRRHIFFTKRRVPKRIDISRYRTGLASTSEVLILGWGVMKMSQKLSYEPIFLQRKHLPVYPNTFCKEVYGDKFITNTMFCAGTMTTGDGACDHDAGGPAILAGKLVGIISFGPTVCGYPNAPTVFTLVGAFGDWIRNVNESMPPYYTGRKRTTTTEGPTTMYFKIPDLTYHNDKATNVYGNIKATPFVRTNHYDGDLSTSKSALRKRVKDIADKENKDNRHGDKNDDAKDNKVENNKEEEYWSFEELITLK